MNSDQSALTSAQNNQLADGCSTSGSGGGGSGGSSGSTTTPACAADAIAVNQDQSRLNSDSSKLTADKSTLASDQSKVAADPGKIASRRRKGHAGSERRHQRDQQPGVGRAQGQAVDPDRRRTS